MPFLSSHGGLIVPAVQKRTRLYGILTSLDPIRLDDPHWQTAIQWETDCSVDASSTLPPCPEPVASKAVDGGLIFCTADPFTVYGTYKCSVGGRPVQDSIEIAKGRLEQNKQQAVERIFWTGQTPVGTV